jgi:hypothetical protein
MNDHRFIELVNLYIDREITAAETAELEVQIQSDPRRRAIYNQYCKINRATSLVYDSFRAQATEAPLPIAGGGTIAHFEDGQRQRRSPFRYYAGGLAAAACVAFAFMQYSSSSQSGGIELSVAQQSPSVEVTATPATQVAAVTPQAEVAPQESLEVRQKNYASLLAALRSDEQRGFADARLKTGAQPESLFSDGVFEVKGLPASINSGLFRNQPQTVTPQTEFTAFQFQR